MAAMFVGAALIIRVASSNHAPAASDCMAADETEVEMEYIDMAVDNTMLDDYSLYTSIWPILMQNEAAITLTD